MSDQHTDQHTDQHSTERPGPLAGVRVLDFTRVLAGPHCTRMLADLGAEVIKVEPPDGGDMTRSFPPRAAQKMSYYFLAQNVGKRNVSIDLDEPDGVELALRLSEECDVLVENFRPGVMASLGLGFDVVHARNPRLVYTSISGYGHDNPWQQRKAFAPLIHAETGLTELRIRRHGPERPFEISSYADTYVGLEALSGLLAALYSRTVTGEGQHVDVDMASTMLCVNDRVPGELGADLADKPDVEAAMSATTRDGRQIVVVGDPASRPSFLTWAKAMDRPDLVEDERFAGTRERYANRDQLLAEVGAWVAEHDLEDLEATLDRLRMPLGVVRTIRELADSEWADARGVIAEVDDRVGGIARIPQAPWRSSSTPSAVRGTVSYPGEDNDAVLGGILGLDEAQIGALAEDGVIRSRLPEARA